MLKFMLFTSFTALIRPSIAVSLSAVVFRVASVTLFLLGFGGAVSPLGSRVLFLENLSFSSLAFSSHLD